MPPATRFPLFPESCESREALPSRARNTYHRSSGTLGFVCNPNAKHNNIQLIIPLAGRHVNHRESQQFICRCSATTAPVEFGKYLEFRHFTRVTTGRHDKRAAHPYSAQWEPRQRRG